MDIVKLNWDEDISYNIKSNISDYIKNNYGLIPFGVWLNGFCEENNYNLQSKYPTTIEMTEKQYVLFILRWS